MNAIFLVFFRIVQTLSHRHVLQLSKSPIKIPKELSSSSLFSPFLIRIKQWRWNWSLFSCCQCVFSFHFHQPNLPTSIIAVSFFSFSSKEFNIHASSKLRECASMAYGGKKLLWFRFLKWKKLRIFTVFSVRFQFNWCDII